MTLQGPIVAIVIWMLTAPQPVLGRDLSPNNWKPEEKATAEQAEIVPWPAQAAVVEGQSGLVAATMSPIAVHAGVEALRQGGTAADAAATVALTQIIMALGSYVSGRAVLARMRIDKAFKGVTAKTLVLWDSGMRDGPSLQVMVLKGFPKKSDVGVVIFGDQNVQWLHASSRRGNEE